MLTLGKFSYYFQLIIVDERQYIAHHFNSPDWIFFFLQGLLWGSFVFVVAVFMAIQQVEKGFPLEMLALAIV